MQNGKIKNIIFDLGNVVVDFDHMIAAKRISHFCGKSPEEIFGLFFNSPITGLFEEGKIAPQDFFQKVKDSLGLSINFATFVPIWNEIFFLSPKNRAVFNLANRLRCDYRVYLLSNINILHYEYLKKHFPVFGIFHAVFTSCELGAVKPDHAIYRKVLESLKAEPASVFYVDDRPELVESAKELGMVCAVFNDVPQLKADLAKAGVNIP